MGKGRRGGLMGLISELIFTTRTGLRYDELAHSRGWWEEIGLLYALGGTRTERTVPRVGWPWRCCRLGEQIIIGRWAALRTPLDRMQPWTCPK